MCLKITVKIKDDKELPRYWITCPACNRTDWYYTLWIEKCDLCGFTFGNIGSIRRNLSRRVRFHENGFEIGKGIY